MLKDNDISNLPRNHAMTKHCSHLIYSLSNSAVLIYIFNQKSLQGFITAFIKVDDCRLSPVTFENSEGKPHSNERTGCFANDSASSQSGVFIKNSNTKPLAHRSLPRCNGSISHRGPYVNRIHAIHHLPCKEKLRYGVWFSLGQKWLQGDLFAAP